MATVTFDNFNGVGHVLTAFDVQADSALAMIMAIREYLNKNPIVSGETVAELSMPILKHIQLLEQ